MIDGPRRRQALRHATAGFAAVVLAAATTLHGAAARADEPVSVFGLPLGGHLSAMPRQCPLLVDKARALCWIDKPFYARSGARVGHVHLPNPETRPGWAARAGFEAEIERDGELKRLRVRTFETTGKFAIAKSITDGFGPPVEDRLAAPVGRALWDRRGTRVDMTCNDADETCLVEFLSPRAVAERGGVQVAGERPRGGARSP